MTAGDAAPAVPGRHAPRPLHGRPGLHDARPPAHPPRRRQQRVRPHILHVITWRVARGNHCYYVHICLSCKEH